MSKPTSLELTHEASVRRIQALGPKLAERLAADLARAAPITWHGNPALMRLAVAYLADPDDVHGLRTDAVLRAAL